ncbi:MAG: hypothetical protein ACYS8W_21350, partial [Planctomycetota bacterium]
MATAWSFTTGTPTLPDQAANPAPPHLAQSVSLTQTLAWDPANGADSYDVYVGLTQGGVSVAGTGSPEFEGNITTPFYTQPTAMSQNTTYYWRIDARNVGGETTGAVWAFRTVKTMPDQASNPSPADAAIDQSLNPILDWDNATLADNYDVYFGDNAIEVDNANTSTAVIYRGNLVPSMFAALPPLTEATTYYWRIDSVNNASGTTKGIVWYFTTGTLPAPAVVIDPPNGSAGEEIIQMLNWENASLATSYDVYLGTDEAAVMNATPATPAIYRGEVSTNSWTTPGLAELTSYYWRIDSKNQAGTVTGSVWWFETGDLPDQANTPFPGNGATNQPGSLNLQWVAAGATISYVFFSDNQTLVLDSDPSAYLGNTAGFSMPVSGLSMNTTHYWRIDTENATGFNIGVIWSFVTGDFPPAALNLAPLNASLVTTPAQQLSWDCGGAVTDSFDVYLGLSLSAVQNENSSNSSGVYMDNWTTDTFDPGTLSAGTTYYWRIDSVNVVGVTKGLVLEFYTIPLPQQAINPWPGNGRTHVDGLSFNITWDCGSEYTDQFYIFFGDNMTQVLNREVPAFLDNTANTQYPVSGLSVLTSYYWAIDPNNAFGNASGALWSFSTTDVPPAAQDVFPTDGTTDISNPTPTIQWDCGAAPPPTNTFELYFSTNKNLVDTLCSSIIVFSGAGKSWGAGPLSAGTSYYWRVAAFNNVGNNTGSTWSFDTEPLPLAPVLIAPADGNTWVSTTGPTLDWNCASIHTDSFNVFLGDNLTAVQVDTWANGAGTFRSNQIGMSHPVTNLIPGTDYYWRIEAVGDMGTNSSGIWTFRVTPFPPLPVNYSPANSDQWVSNTTPTLEWSNGGAITDSFDVYFDGSFSAVNSADTGTPIIYVGNTTGNNSAIPGASLPLVPGTSYYWRVDSVNAIGMSKNSVWSFRVTPLPPAPINLTPDNETWDIPTSAALSWQC